MFRLTAAVAEYAEILRGSYWAQEGSLDDVLYLARIRPASELDERERLEERRGRVHLAGRAGQRSCRAQACHRPITASPTRNAGARSQHLQTRRRQMKQQRLDTENSVGYAGSLLCWRSSPCSPAARARTGARAR